MATTRTIETIDELKELVGQEMGVGAWFEITQERVDAFADVTGDHQWIHVDPARAAATPFGGTIAHGFLTLSMHAAAAAGLGGVHDRPAPRKMGDQLRAEPRALHLAGARRQADSPAHEAAQRRRVAPDAYQMTYQQTVEIEGEERPAMVAETITRLYI